MRKLVVLTFVTLDGVMQAPGGPGIVHVEVRGNTNEVSLVKWFQDGMHQ